MAPTEYRVIAKRTDAAPLRRACAACVAAGEALNPEVLRAWEEATGLQIRDGYGQTETGQLTGAPLGEPVRPGSMGRALPGIDAVDRRRRARRRPARPSRRSSSAPPRDAAVAHRRPRAPGRGRLPLLRGPHRRRDHLAPGYRIGPFEVESALVAHPAVAEAAVVAAPDEERGAVVRAVVVLRDGHDAGDALARELQDHVKRETAPYKYPRIVDFADELPKTASGKIRRALLRCDRSADGALH